MEVSPASLPLFNVMLVLLNLRQTRSNAFLRSHCAAIVAAEMESNTFTLARDIYGATGATLLDVTHLTRNAAGKFWQFPGCPKEIYQGGLEGRFTPEFRRSVSLSHWHQMSGSLWNIYGFMLGANGAIHCFVSLTPAIYIPLQILLALS